MDCHDFVSFKMKRTYLLLVVVLVRLFSTALPLPPPKENFPSHKRHVLEGPEFIEEEASALARDQAQTTTYSPEDVEYELLGYPCVYEGIEYEHGSYLQYGCNTCYCFSGLFACTQIRCIHGFGPFDEINRMAE